MSYIAQYLAEVESFFFDLLTYDTVEIASLLKLCEVMELQGEYKSVYSPISLENLVLLHGSIEKNYTLDEINYLQCSCKDVVFCTCNETGHAVIISEIDNHEKEKNLVASAITKIVLKAFGDNVLLCFKCNRQLALAVASRSHDEKDEYHLSPWYSRSCIPILVELCSNCSGDFDEIIYAIEKATQTKYEQKYYDTTRYDYEYIAELQYIASQYGFDVSEEINRYWDFFFSPVSPIDSDNDVQAINNILKYIGIDENSSYDYLEKASGLALASTEHMKRSEISENEFEPTDRVRRIPTDIFSDAEKMMRYLEKEGSTNDA